MIVVFYSWTALSGISGSSVAMGITDDRARAMRAGEESLDSGSARSGVSSGPDGFRR